MQRPSLISVRRQRTMDVYWRPCSLTLLCRCPDGLILRLRLLGYEPTGCGLTWPPGSQTCRSRSTARSSHHGASHIITAVAPCLVHKSVHNLRRQLPPPTGRRRCGRTSKLPHPRIAGHLPDPEGHREQRPLPRPVRRVWLWQLFVTLCRSKLNPNALDEIHLHG